MGNNKLHHILYRFLNFLEFPGLHFASIIDSSSRCIERLHKATRFQITYLGQTIMRISLMAGMSREMSVLIPSIANDTEKIIIPVQEVTNPLKICICQDQESIVRGEVARWDVKFAINSNI